MDKLALLGSEIFLVSAIPISYVLCAKKVLNMTKKNLQHQLSQSSTSSSLVAMEMVRGDDCMVGGGGWVAVPSCHQGLLIGSFYGP